MLPIWDMPGLEQMRRGGCARLGGGGCGPGGKNERGNGLRRGAGSAERSIRKAQTPNPFGKRSHVVRALGT